MLPLTLDAAAPGAERDASLADSGARLIHRAGASPGAMVTDNVRLVRLLAEGGMGSVWLGHHLGLDMPVAVKFMSEWALRTTPAAVERFTREARAAAQIRHPNVVQILDFGCSPLVGGTPYIVMEHLEGEDLERYIEHHGSLDLEDTVAIVLTVASVLEKAHELGIVHRDIKPENVFLHGPDRIVKVLDFGVARDEKDLSMRTTQAGELLGTPFFMSPEQFVNPREADYRCDLWALAVLAYESLFARVPFDGDTPTAVFLSTSRGGFPLPSRVRPELPRALDAWFRTAFAVAPAHRFPSARAMADAFVRAATVSSDDSPHRPELARLDLRAHRRRTATGIAVVSAAMFVGVFVGRGAGCTSSASAPAVAARESTPPREPAATVSASPAELPAVGPPVELVSEATAMQAPTPPPRTKPPKARQGRVAPRTPPHDAPAFYFLR